MGLAVQLKELYDIKTDIWSAICENREETITKAFSEFPDLIEPRYIMMPGTYWSPLKKFYTQVGRETIDGKLYLIYQCEFDPDGEHLVTDLATECFNARLHNAELTDTPAPVDNPEDYTCLYVSNQNDVDDTNVVITEFNIDFRGFDEFTVYVSVYAGGGTGQTVSLYIDGDTAHAKTVSSSSSNSGNSRTYTARTFTGLDYNEHTLTVKYTNSKYTPTYKTWIYFKLPVEPIEDETEENVEN